MLKTTHKQSWDASFDSGKYLLRRVNIHDPFLVVDPKKQRRRSKDTSNLYVAMMDTLDSWGDYPRRGYSVMFGTTKSTITAYTGLTYYCFVENDAKLAVSSLADLWHSWPYISKRTMEIYGIDSFCDLIETSLPSAYYQVFGTKLPILTDDSYTEDNIHELYKVLNTYLTHEVILTMIKSLQSPEIVKNATSRYGNIKTLYFLNDIMAHDGWKNYKAYFNELLDPEKNSFRLTTIEGIDNGSEHEVWSEAEVILIHENEMDGISFHMTKGPDDD